MVPLAVKFVVRDVVVFIRLKKPACFENSSFAKPGRSNSSGMTPCLTPASCGVRHVPAHGLVGGGRRSRRLAKGAGDY